MDETQNLLAEYVENGSEAAFRELVARYINLVYSTALRMVGGDAATAEDVTQTVFVNLARKARSLPPNVMLGGWLHRDACFAAGTAMRGERRRQFREQEAAAMNDSQDHTAANLALVTPVLDEAINELEADDRAAIMLRFFEQLEFRAIGEKLGSNEDAARMRVSRALDKLQGLLKKRGVSFSVTALGVAMAAEAVKAAPFGLAAKVAATALTTAAVSTPAATFLKWMTMTKLKIAAVSLVAAAVLATPVIIQHQSIAKLRADNQALQEKTAQLAPLQEDNERLSNLVAQAGGGSARSSDAQVRELARLRNEVGLLRDQTNAMSEALEGRRQLNANPNVSRVGIANGKRNFRGTTMAEFAKFIAGVLGAPVADQTGLTGRYDISMTPPRAGGQDGKVERVKGILLDELGLQLVPFGGPFSDEELQTAQTMSPVLPDDAPQGSRMLSQISDGKLQIAVVYPDGTTKIITPPKLSPDTPGFALKLDHSDAPGRQSSTGEDAQTFAQGNRLGGPAPPDLPPGVFEANSPAVPLTIANNLRLIDAAKQQWALEKGQRATDTPGWNILKPYIGRGQNADLSEFTNNPNGEYVIGAVNEQPQFHANESYVANLAASGASREPSPPLSPAESARNACINNLRLIDAAKQQWALEHGKRNTDVPTENDIRPYMGRSPEGEFPVCPDGGVYNIKAINEIPTCSIPGHVLP